MYLEHFGLQDHPFRMTPDSRYLYLGTAHARAMAYMEYTVWNRDSFVVITGEIGSGKTTLIQKLLSALDDRVVVARIYHTQLDENEFLQAFLVDLGLDPFGLSKVQMLGKLNEYFLDQYAAGKRIVLVVDEAQNLSRRVLEEIRLLSGLETYQEKILNVILVGQPELNTLLDAPGMEQLVQRVRLRFHIQPFDPTETKAYVEHRLNVAGSTRNDIFAADAFAALYQYTGGTPRLLNSLCDTALICAYADGIHQVDGAVVRIAVQELQWTTYEERMERHRGPPEAAAAGAAGVITPPAAAGSDVFRLLSEEIARLEERLDRIAGSLNPRA
ncbi:MAG: AAA family ATPase [Gammaproteobacteria bacterium]|nr:AAA family ATPase [Gammaproteobacteria bacterium]